MTDLTIAITKGKSSVTINTDELPEEVYKEALIQGLKVLLNRGMSKITKETYPNAEELKAAAMAKAESNVTDAKAGKVKITGGKAKSGVSGVVMTEARRLARNLVKDEMKRQGIKISYVEASEITKAANALIADDPTILETAKANLEERAKVPVKINVASIPISAKKKAAAEKAKAEKKGQLSAKQAGMTTKVKPQATA